MKSQKYAKMLPYEFLRTQIKRNKLFKDLTNDDIDFIIYNQLKNLAKERSWIKQISFSKQIPFSVFQHR
ncbi:hypothetical protein HOD83_01305 [Candidatus Woesearchaeota archaeon]|nr:hypothetical protein [Candidatus Woesearchaeota archaeon]MBT4248208.1 hypothetical protein [Candidatus Woesearchaeota archaeon]